MCPHPTFFSEDGLAARLLKWPQQENGESGLLGAQQNGRPFGRCRRPVSPVRRYATPGEGPCAAQLDGTDGVVLIKI